MFALERDGTTIGKVQRYVSGRYISSNEVIWRVHNFPIHEKYPTVVTSEWALGKQSACLLHRRQYWLYSSLYVNETASLKLCFLVTFRSTTLLGTYQESVHVSCSRCCRTWSFWFKKDWGTWPSLYGCIRAILNATSSDCCCIMLSVGLHLTRPELLNFLGQSLVVHQVTNRIKITIGWMN
jgi:hypothetical protein